MITPNPFDTIQQIAGGYCLARCLHVITDIGVADVLNDTPKSAAELAGNVGADPDALFRALRLLTAYNIFELNSDKFSHTPASRLIRKDHPQSMNGFVRMFSLPINWKAYEAFHETIKTGEPAVEKIYPGGFWKYFSDHKEDSNIFNSAMADKANGQLHALWPHIIFLVLKPSLILEVDVVTYYRRFLRPFLMQEVCCLTSRM